MYKGPRKSSDMYKSKLKIKTYENSSTSTSTPPSVPSVPTSNDQSGDIPMATIAQATACVSPAAASSEADTTSDTTTITAATTATIASTINPPLKKFSLRGNQLCGSILIGNYNYLTQLEVSENEMEILDLTSLMQLETLKCNHNKLMELMLNGGSLTSVIANHNCLHAITVINTPTNLINLDISHNEFSELPHWIGSCSNLQTLSASNNQLQTVAKFLATYKITALRSLNIGYNNLRALNRLPERMSSLEQFQLQSNELQSLPENFFNVTWKHLRLLNVSCNKLAAVAARLEFSHENEEMCRLDELYLSNNNLSESLFGVLVHARKLRILHAAYNRIQQLPAECIRGWPEMEELVLSGNMLQHLPDNIATLSRLQVLRMHSNLLLTTPTLCKLSNLKVLDLAHNHLDHVNLVNIVPKSLKYLDLSCNLQLQVDEQQVRVCQSQSQRNWSLVDVSGKNRSSLPTTKLNELRDIGGLKPPWSLGFSETLGKNRKLLASQLRESNFRTDEALFGIFESASSSAAVNTLAQLVPQILQQERTVKETISDYMKYTLLSAQQKLFNSGEYQAVSATICHIARESSRSTKDYVRPLKTKKYVLRVASVGNIHAYLLRKTTNVCLTQASSDQQLMVPVEQVTGNKSQKVLFPDPEVTEITLCNDDEYLVICNGHVWQLMDIDRVSREVRKEENVVISAKRVQDIAQSFRASGNISVIVVRFRNIGTDVDHLIKELKRSVKKKPIAPLPPSIATCKRTCCERSNACRHRIEKLNGGSSTGTGSGGVYSSNRQLTAIARSDRSSPSGQSDQAVNMLGKDTDADADDYILAHARVLEEQEQQQMEMLDETESVLSEEQFKCWEYMLEQNTQLLFDKELNTISRSYTKNRNNERKMLNSDRSEYKSNLLKNINNKLISSSSPQLLYNETKKSTLPLAYNQQASFLSKHFGSTRSFQNSSGYNLFETSKSREALSAYAKLGGGPNAAYFGSLQRLMPYNLEYDFAVMQERSSILDEDDEYEHENRMRKYWGVATTEL